MKGMIIKGNGFKGARIAPCAAAVALAMMAQQAAAVEEISIPDPTFSSAPYYAAYVNRSIGAILGHASLDSTKWAFSIGDSSTFNQTDLLYKTDTDGGTYFQSYGIVMYSKNWKYSITFDNFKPMTTGGDIEFYAASDFVFSGVDDIPAGATNTLVSINRIYDNGVLTIKRPSINYYLGTALQGTGTLSLASIHSENNGLSDTVIFTADGGTSSSGSGSASGSSGTGSSDSGDDSSSSTSDNAANASGSLLQELVRNARIAPQVSGVSMSANAGHILMQDGMANDRAAMGRLALSGLAGFQTFAATSGAVSREDTGAGHWGMKEFHLAAGVGANKTFSSGEYSFGAFIETGFGSFKDHFNAGYAEGRIDKKGHARYTGGGAGIEARFNSGWHAGLAVRLGSVKTTSNNSIYNPALDATGGYEISASYYGSELSGGKRIAISDANSADIYARYTYAHQEGDSFKVFSDTYKIGAIDSYLLAAGVNFEHKLDGGAVYGGFGYEQALDGKASVKARPDGIDYWFNTGSASSRGGRAFAEGGFRWARGGFEATATLRGAAGSDYRSFGAVADAKYVF